MGDFEIIEHADMFDGVLVGDFRPAKPEPFVVHTITITNVWVNSLEDELKSEGECWEGEVEYEYDLDHGTCPYEECSVWMDLHEGGSLRDVLMGSSYYWGNEEKQPYPWKTTYYVRTWVSRHDIPGEPVEYDQGLDVSTVRSDL